MSLNNDIQRYFIGQGNDGMAYYHEQLQQTITSLSSTLAANKWPAPEASPSDLATVISQLGGITNEAKEFTIVLEETLKHVINNSVLVNHPYCCAHLHCPPLIPALAAEVLLTAVNQSMDSWDQAPAATLLEQNLIDWLCHTTALGDKADGGFTSGGTQSNLIGLLLARDHSIAKHNSGYSVQHKGLPENASRYRILCSDVAHFTITKSCALLGLGRDSVVTVKSNVNGEMCTQALKEKLLEIASNHEIPMAIVATAGTTDLGAIDPMEVIAAIADEYDCWLHVDAAYAGALLLSDQKQRLQGLSKADSVTIDFHKMFFQPISCGALLVKDRKKLAPLCFHADYLSRVDDEELNLVDKSISTTRRFDALKLWMSLQTIGLDNFSSMITKLLALAQYASEKIDQAPDLELLNKPSLSTVLFRVITHHGDSNKFQQMLRRALLQSGQAVVAETRIKNKIYLKLTLLNPCTTHTDINGLLALVVSTARKIHINVSAA